jgi:hypothetical protein
MYYRTKEEVYDLRQDPHALNNLVDSPAVADEIGALRKRMSDVFAGECKSISRGCTASFVRTKSSHCADT